MMHRAREAGGSIKPGAQAKYDENDASSLRSRRQHKAWGASPRIEIEIMSRARAVGDSAAARYAGSGTY
jgi:hypothetical protein